MSIEARTSAAVASSADLATVSEYLRPQTEDFCEGVRSASTALASSALRAVTASAALKSSVKFLAIRPRTSPDSNLLFLANTSAPRALSRKSFTPSLAASERDGDAFCENVRPS